MSLRAPLNARLVTVFVSSGNSPASLRRLRDRLQGFVDHVLNPMLFETGEQLRLQVVRWEDYAAQRSAQGVSTNERFVQAARDSHLTVVLLIDDIRTGTLEELEAVLDEQDVE